MTNSRSFNTLHSSQIKPCHVYNCVHPPTCVIPSHNVYFFSAYPRTITNGLPAAYRSCGRVLLQPPCLPEVSGDLSTDWLPSTRNRAIHALHRSFSWHVGSGLLGIEDPGKLCWYGIHGIRFIGLMIFQFSVFYGFLILIAEEYFIPSSYHAIYTE